MSCCCRAVLFAFVASLAYAQAQTEESFRVSKVEGRVLEIDAGASGGVQTGLTGTALAKAQIAGRSEVISIARFTITAVDEQRSTAEIVSLADGWDTAAIRSVTFDKPLVPVRRTPERPPTKPEPPTDFRAQQEELEEVLEETRRQRLDAVLTRAKRALSDDDTGRARLHLTEFEAEGGSHTEVARVRELIQRRDDEIFADRQLSESAERLQAALDRKDLEAVEHELSRLTQDAPSHPMVAAARAELPSIRDLQSLKQTSAPLHIVCVSPEPGHRMVTVTVSIQGRKWGGALWKRHRRLVLEFPDVRGGQVTLRYQIRARLKNGGKSFEIEAKDAFEFVHSDTSGQPCILFTALEEGVEIDRMSVEECLERSEVPGLKVTRTIEHVVQ